MNSDLKTGNEGAFRLSGRKSIHNHGTHCPFWNCEAMGRYGMRTDRRQDQEKCSTSQEGTDEVDNVMSKFARASSPIAIRKNDHLRRNSLKTANQMKHNYSDDSDEDSNLLSKSSPAILSSCSCCSEEAEGAVSANYANESASSSVSQTRLNASHTNSIYNTSPQNAQNARRNIDKASFNMYQSKKGSKKLLLSSVIITALVGIVIAYYNVFFKTDKIANIIYDKFSFYNDMEGVGNKYKVSDNSILQVRAGIATIFERQDTGSFIFAYDSDKGDFKSVDFNNFINELASATAKYLRNHTKSVQHVVVDTSNLQIKSDKDLMNEYAEDVDKTGVMLVKDLDKVPSAVAMAFHYYCDEYNPLVKKSAIFFTLNMARCSNGSSEKYTHKYIEECLTEKWAKMPQDNIRPLLNRVVNVVIDVTRDF